MAGLYTRESGKLSPALPRTNIGVSFFGYRIEFSGDRTSGVRSTDRKIRQSWQSDPRRPVQLLALVPLHKICTLCTAYAISVLVSTARPINYAVACVVVEFLRRRLGLQAGGNNSWPRILPRCKPIGTVLCMYNVYTYLLVLCMIRCCYRYHWLTTQHSRRRRTLRSLSSQVAAAGGLDRQLRANQFSYNCTQTSSDPRQEVPGGPSEYGSMYHAMLYMESSAQIVGQRC